MVGSHHTLPQRTGGQRALAFHLETCCLLYDLFACSPPDALQQTTLAMRLNEAILVSTTANVTKATALPARAVSTFLPK